MKTYRFNEGELQIPDAWKDLTVHSFVVPAASGSGTASVVITRDADTPAREVQHYVDLQMVEAAQKLKGYQLVDRRATTAGGQPAAELTYTWTTPDRAKVKQRQVCIRHNEAFLIVTLSAKADDFPKHENALEAVVRSLRLR